MEKERLFSEFLFIDSFIPSPKFASQLFAQSGFETEMNFSFSRM